ncbi:MAG: hypothetical protein EOO71_39550 [Myxococcaceae bacterium]|nr:MAG: hypothetical protein EOO71_39550 [Myxococcaceae bacterium]
MRVTIIAGLMAVGLLAGCGGVENAVDEQDTLATREDALPFCGNQEFDRVYYAEPARTTEVGGWRCICDVSSPLQWGAKTGYYVDTQHLSCPAP